MVETASSYTIVAEDPGDISIRFKSSGGEHTIPLKSISVQKSIDVTPEYGTGNHEKYGQTQGKIDYKGDFEIGTWWVSAAENPSTWMDLIKLNLTYENSGLGREFDIVISDTGLDYERSMQNGPTTISANDTGIVTFKRCLLTGDSLSVGNVGSTCSTKYSFSAMYRTTK
jgi:hypothetical protein